MSRYYTYLVSSLPMLHFGARPPFSFEKFLSMCEGLIPDGDLDIIKASSLKGEYAEGAVGSGTLEKWRAFDAALRNELVRIRASRKRLDPNKYLRGDGYAEPSIGRGAMNAHRSASVLEAERMLDQERWGFLEALNLGRYFDLDSLIIYAHKLLILEKWERVRKAQREKLVEEVVGKD